MQLPLSRLPRDPFGLFKAVPIQGGGMLENEDSILLTRFVAYRIIAPIIVTFGLIGNILTIVILKNPMFKGVMFNFFFALAIFDFLSLVLSISAIMHLLNPATTSYATAVWYSYLEVLFINSTMGSSVLIVVCITFDRYMSVWHPYHFKTFHSDRFCKLGISISFAISFLVWFPTCFLKRPSIAQECETFHYTSDVQNSTLWVACQVIDPSLSKWYNVYAWVREIIISFLPIVIVIILNGFLVKYFVEKHSRPASNSSNGRPANQIVTSPSREAGDKNLSGLLKAIIISFLITILPAGVFNAAYSENLSTNIRYEVFRASANNLELLNHALNFYLYILLSKPIRSALPSLTTYFKEITIGRLKNKKTNSLPPEGANSVADVQRRWNVDILSVHRQKSKTDSRQTHCSNITLDESSKDHDLSECHKFDQKELNLKIENRLSMDPTTNGNQLQECRTLDSIKNPSAEITDTKSTENHKL